MTGQGCVGAREYGPEVGTEGDRPERRDSESLGRESSDCDGNEVVCAGLAVEAGWMVSCLMTT